MLKLCRSLLRWRPQLGLTAGAAGADGDAELFESLLNTMAATGADFTRTFRTLMDLELPSDATTSGGMTETEAAAVERAAIALSASLAARDDLLTAIRPRIEEERVNMLVRDVSLLSSVLLPRQPSLSVAGHERELVSRKLKLRPSHPPSQTPQPHLASSNHPSL